MELLQTENYFIFNKNEDSLWFNRRTGSFESKTCWDMASAKNPSCIGIVHGIIGKLQILPDVAPRLALVTGVKEIGHFGESKGSFNLVYCITKVIFLPLTTNPIDCDLNIDECPKHAAHPHSGSQDRKNVLPFGDFQPKVGLSKTFGTLKNVTSSIKTATVNAAANATGQNKNRKEMRDKERFERRILDELQKMFNEYESFYFSSSVDLTNTLQRQNESTYDISLPLHKRADDRFFWNKQMLSEFQDSQVIIPAMWITPIIQGFVQIEKILLDSSDKTFKNFKDESLSNGEMDSFYTITLISRRSRYRAGTRYKRRGVDDQGFVANYVESEQIIRSSHHQLAFVQVRGSVPVFWSQPGYKYRPPPRLDRDSEEIAKAFKAHFDSEFEIYKNVSCVSLVDQGGKEKVIADAYLDHIIELDSALLTFISFDFHEYCRGMRYENVSVLVENIEDVINCMGYCWVDKQGVICRQNGVFRINCIDCLDRTNVVQTALAKAVLENKFVKLGILVPEQPLPANCRSTLQLMWANNGDIISKQYAGTSALKGDFTRTGERNFAGLMKDGMNSANRYYLNRFKDAYRQATIDTMLGNPISEDILSLNPEVTEEEDASLAQHVKHVIDDCKTLLVPDEETILGAWGLIDADPTCDPDQGDMDVILVLTRDSYYVAQYDEAADRISNFERISLIDLYKIEVGPFTFQGMFKQSKTHLCIRLLYHLDGNPGFFHTFRSMNIRFFNNMAITIKTDEEIIESVKAIGDTFEVAVEMVGCDVEATSGKLEKLRKKTTMVNPLNLFSPISSFTRPSPDSLKNAGTRAFSNMTSGLARLNPMASLRSKKEDIVDISKIPAVSILDAPALRPKNDYYLRSCGIVSSCIKFNLESPNKCSPQRSSSDSHLSTLKIQETFPLPNRSATPEILISVDGACCNTGGQESSKGGSASFTNFLSTSSLTSSRLRKLSHSSDEVDAKEDDVQSSSLQKASSTTELDLQFPIPRGENSRKVSSPLSPLANFNKETVLAPFTVFAKGVQSLAPGAGMLARGVQNIGANLDPRKLKQQRQKQLEEDIELNARKAKCKSRIIQF